MLDTVGIKIYTIAKKEEHKRRRNEMRFFKTLNQSGVDDNGEWWSLPVRKLVSALSGKTQRG